MDALRNDLRLAFRQIRRRPAFALVASASLALGVGANTAIFNAVSALLLRPVPGVSEAERVVEVGRTQRGEGFDSFSYPDYEDLRDEVAAFASMAAWRFQIFSFSRAGEGERITGMDVSPSYFEVLGVRPALGRFFTVEEDLPGSRPAVTVLSHDFWTSRLGADPDVLGSTVLINRVAFTVVGVAPEPFHGHVVGVQPDLYRPIRMYAAAGGEGPFERRGSSWHQAVARLADGASIPEADAQVKAVYARLEEAYPATNEGRGGAVVALGLVPGGARGPVSAFLSVLFALAGLILMVTCANVAGMLIARASAREKEIAVRLALGGRGRLVRQLLTESLVVFGIGGLAGAALGVWLVGLLPIDRLPVPIPVRVDLSPDFGVLAFALALTLGTGVVFGLLPALQATRLQLVASLRDDGSRRSGAGRLRRVFVGGQVGLSLVLLMSAALFLRSLQRAAGVATGFDPSSTYVTGVDLSLEGYDEASGAAFQIELLRRLRGTGGVESAALTTELPLDLGSSGTGTRPEGWEGHDPDDVLSVEDYRVSSGYLETLRIPLLEGRGFGDLDVEGAEPVVIVSRELVREVWPAGDALGRRILVDNQLRTVVGVVEDVKNQFLTDAPTPTTYLPLAQAYDPDVNVLVRTAGDIAGVTGAIRRAVLDVDGSLSLPPVVGLEDYTSLGIMPQRIAASITSALGVLALLLAGIGVYGVVAFAVTQRTREIGVRMALGAQRGGIVVLIVRGGLALALPGLVLGGAAAVGVGYVLRAFLLGLSPVDPVALVSVAAALLGVVLLACVVPARRASAVEPVRALRSE